MAGERRWQWRSVGCGFCWAVKYHEYERVAGEPMGRLSETCTDSGRKNNQFS